jgi:hypothetical protein
MSATLIQLLTEREIAIRQTVTIITAKYKIDPVEAQQLLDWMLVQGPLPPTACSDSPVEQHQNMEGFWRGDEWINE